MFNRRKTVDLSTSSAVRDLATLDDVLASLSKAEQRHAAISRTRKFSERLAPLLDFLYRYGNAIDSIAQGVGGNGLNPASIAWGVLKALIEMTSSMARYFPLLIDMLEKLGATLSLYRQYEQLFPDDPRLKLALSAVYGDVLVLLQRAEQAFERRGIALLFRGIWSTFESEFQHGLSRLAMHMFVLEGETTLAHRKHVHKALQPAGNEAITNAHNNKAQRRDIMRWLGSADTASDLVQLVRRRTVGTGLWLVQEENFVQWREATKASVLWIYGIPGAGKSVLSTTVVQHLTELYQEPGYVTAFYYFNRLDQGTRTELPMLASIISQICARSSQMPAAVTRGFENADLYGRSRLSMSDSPVSLFKAAVETLNCLFLVVDGVDESEDPAGILDTLQYLVSNSSNIHLLVSSRHIPSIQDALSTYPCIQIDSSRTDQDVRIYLTSAVEKLPANDAIRSDLMMQRIVARSSGMFLFAYLIIESLSKAASPADLMSRLEELPSGISAFYGDYLERLCHETESRRLLAKKILFWVCFSRRPMNWAELQSALADSASSELSSQYTAPFKPAVLSLGSPFVVYEELSDRFNLQHLSMRDFLVSRCAREELPARAHQFLFNHVEGEKDLAQVCLSRILAAEDQDHHSALVEYATVFWCDHLLACPWSRELYSLLMTFACDVTSRRRWIRNMLKHGNQGFSMQKVFKFQADLNEWIHSSNLEDEPNKALQDLDWSEDVVQILLELPSEHKSDATLQLQYFEKIMVIRDLARLLNQSKRLDDGVQWLETAYNSQSHRKPVDLVWILNSLAILYDQRGEKLKSLATQKQALSIQETELGAFHIETINTVNELGRIYRHLGDYNNASKMHLRALAVLESQLADPQDDLQVIWTISTLARTYRKQGRLLEALSLFQRAYSTRSRILGSGHPHTLWILGDIAATYRDMGCLLEAEKYHTKALEERSITLGPKHPDTLWSMNDLGLVVADLGRHIDAMALQEKALEGQTQVLGKDHQHTLWTRNVLRDLQNSGRDSAVGFRERP